MIRLFDLFWSIIGLLLLSPFFIIVAVAIKLGDGGPVLFKQVRVGRNRQHFRILKFRTMSMGEDQAGLPITVGQDARITRVGRWLRKWKIDEFPQLINVLRGEMGLVGPRPEIPRYVSFYSEEQARVLSLRPGITDAASIAYRSENEVLGRSEDPETFYIQNIMPNKIRINLEYAPHATVWTNLKIILATLGMLPPPVRVRPAGDLRAFDRDSLGVPVHLSIGHTHPSEAQPLNISIGGILLQSQSNLSVGRVCNLTISHENPDLEPILVEGVVIRIDDQGTAVRFSRPLKEKEFRSIKKSR